MTIIIAGKITMQNATCEKCGSVIQLWTCENIIRCNSCGAIYNVSTTELKDQYVEFTFNFVEFQCMHSNISGNCTTKCPAPEMYCKDHTSDEAFKDANNNISYCEDRLLIAKEKLQKMEESKKIWLIEEVSGINENNIIPKN
jgi:hypothetical protein